MPSTSIITVNLIQFLNSTISDDVRIEYKDEAGEWKEDRYMRTCTVKTGLQELVNYRRDSMDKSIRLVAEDGSELVIHEAGTRFRWC